jgi:hypothetical protein
VHKTLKAPQASRHPKPSQHTTKQGKESQNDHRATDAVAAKLTSGAASVEKRNKKTQAKVFRSSLDSILDV